MDSWAAVVFSYLALGLALATASVTLTRARIFQPVRDWAKTKNFLLFKLVSCPYCMAHWLALGLVPYTTYVITDFWLADALVTWFLLVGIAALFEGLIMNGLLMQESYIQELEQEIEDLPLRHQTELNEAIGNARAIGFSDGQRQERERYAAMDLKLRAPITSS